MASVISICNQKGGVGKSTTAVNLGSYLAISGKKVLVIDLDSQGNATICCGIDRTTIQKTIYDGIRHNADLPSLVIKSVVPSMDVIPSSIELADLDAELAGQQGRESLLKQRIESLQSLYDVIVFDCPPSLGLITLSALTASDGVLIPVQCEYLAMEGLNSLLKTVDRVRNNFNPRLKILGIVLTMADFRTSLSQEVAGEVKSFFKDLVMTTSIPRNVRLAESPSFGRPICLYDPESTGAIAYSNLAKEFLGKMS